MEKYVTKGYIFETRNFGNLLFLIIRNGYDYEQITFFKKENPDLYAIAKDLTKESIIKVVGEKKVSEQAMNGYEVIPETLEVLSVAKAPIPLNISGKIESTFDTRINNRYIDLRIPKNRAIFKIRSSIVRATTDYFDNNDFFCINTPKLVEGGVESGAQLFKVDYFGRPAYLAQSPQVYKEMMIVGGFNKVYEIGEVFRAENSNTTRHLTEFTGIDFEIGFIEDYNDVMDVVEGLMKEILTYVNKNNKREMELLGINIKIPEKMPRVKMSEVKKMLKEKGKILSEEDDLDPESEKLVYEIAKEKYDSEFMFVTDYPFSVRPFYHMCYKDATGKRTTYSFDLIWKGCEICTGAQREHRPEILEEQITDKGMNLKDMEYYIRMASYGSPPHGGTGLGLDRIAQLLIGLLNVKEAVLFPRDPDRLNP